MAPSSQPTQPDYLRKVILPSLAALVILIMIASQSASDPEAGEGLNSVPQSLSQRVILPQASEGLARGEVEKVALALDLGPPSPQATPRVTPLDKISPLALAKSDAGDDAQYLSVIAAEKKANTINQVQGIRTRLLLEAAERALISPTPWADLSLVALSFQRLGDGEAARYWFDRASRLAHDPNDSLATSRALREVAKNAVSAGFYHRATELIARIPEAAEKSRARAELVRSYARRKNFKAAHRLASSLSDLKARGMALRSIAEGEARSEGIEKAQQTLQLISDPNERDRAFASVASIRAAMGDSDGSRTLLAQIRKAATREAALARLAALRRRGGVGSIQALVSLLHDPAFRDQALRQLIKREASRLGVGFSNSPHSHSYSHSGLASAQSRAQAYEALVMLQVRHGDLDGALARAQSIHLDAARFRALQAIAVAEVRKRGARAARHIANLIGDGALREATFGQIAQRAAVYGQNEGAVATIQHIEAPSERALAFAHVGLTQARYGRDRSARIAVQDATRELQNVEDSRDKARAQGLVAEVFAETGDADAALSAAAEIPNRNLRDSTYQRVALSFAKLSEPSIAEKSAALIERPATRERARDSIATTLARKVSLTDAVGYASRLEGHRQQVRFLLGVAGRKS